MDEAARCDRLLLMRDGDILADETPEALLAETGAPDAEGAFLTLIRRHHPRHALEDKGRADEEGEAGS
jgi:ABC-2 type transport system ATP-binding protein